MGDNRTLLSGNFKKFMGVIMSEVLSLRQLCNNHWKAKTPNAVRKDISRGVTYPFLIKIGKTWLANLERFNEWHLKKEQSFNSLRR